MSEEYRIARRHAESANDKAKYPDRGKAAMEAAAKAMNRTQLDLVIESLLRALRAIDGAKNTSASPVHAHALASALGTSEASIEYTLAYLRVLKDMENEQVPKKA